MKTFKIILLFFVIAILPITSYAQVTSSTASGIIRDPAGQPLDGATVSMVHTPSGTTYQTSTQTAGTFSLLGLRVGGPYTLKVTHISYHTYTQESIMLALGEVVDFQIDMQDAAYQSIDEVSITAPARAPEKTGATTVIDSRQLSALPSYNRSISDLTSLTPQSNGGNSFAGRSGYFNNLKVDGANLNNSFGLSSNPLPGGGSSPISLDAFDQVSVNIAPVDVRQSGFTGAGINAVTKSGTNEFKGSVFTYYRDHTFSGLRAGDIRLERATVASSRKYFGGSLGGPIIPNKLFFFVNGEYETNSGNRITNWVPDGSPNAANSGNVSSTHIDSLAKLSNFLRDRYGYETGAYDDYPIASRSNYKYMVKLDWNINNQHKLTAKFNDFVSNEDPSSINNSAVIGGGGFHLTGGTSLLSSLPNGRMGNRSMVFANSVYGFERTVRSGTVELNSNIGRFSNSLLLTNTFIQDTRTTHGAPFPFVEIFDGTAVAHNYMSFGYEPYSYNNDVINKVWSITDNFTYTAGRHVLTGGFSYEHQMVGNMFMPGAQSYYIYNSLNDFMTDQAPLYYSYAYSMVAGKPAVYSAELKYGEAALYIQDEIRASDRLRITIGLRAEKPIFTEKALENPAVTALELPNKDGVLTHYDGQWPNTQINLSPRVGLRYDLKGDRSTIFRLSTGIYTGLSPFVWLTNMPTNSGMYQNSVSLRNSHPDEAALLDDMTFDPNLDAYAHLFPPVAGTAIPANVVLIDKNFKFPQIFRTNLGMDHALGKGFHLTLDALISKDIQAVQMRNANLKSPTGIAAGPDNRPIYLSNSPSDRSIYPSVSSAIILENNNKGYSYALTAQLSKDFSKGLFGSIAYTHTGAKDIGNNSGSQAYQIWNTNPTIGNSNAFELHPSASALRHRIIGNISYRLEYLEHAATTFSLIYEGRSGSNLTYRYNGDLNGDGNNQDLLFVPEKASDLNFEPYTQTVNGVTYHYTAEQQAAAFDAFINNTPYLDSRRGKYAERNGGNGRWMTDLSARVMQEFFVRTSDRTHTLQVSADFLNFANLLNRFWGIQSGTTTTQPLAFRSSNSDGEPVFRMQQTGGKLYDQPFQYNYGSSSTWRVQLGVRYLF